MHLPFFETIESAELDILRGGTLSLLDPISWLCADDCLVMKDGEPLYRDSHHLSLSGAMALEKQLFKGLTTVLEKGAESEAVNVIHVSQFSTSGRYKVP